MKWIDVEVREISGLLRSWPGRWSDEYWENFSATFGKYYGRTVIRALQEIQREQEENRRPPFSAIRKKVSAIIEAAKSSAGTSGPCDFCLGYLSALVVVYPTPREILESLPVPIPERALRWYADDAALVHAEIAAGVPEVAERSREVRLFCGHCRHEKGWLSPKFRGVASIEEWTAERPGFWRPVSRDAEYTIWRVLQASAPPADAVLPTREPVRV